MDEKLSERSEYAAALNGPNKRKYILGRSSYALSVLDKLIPMLEAAAIAQKATGSTAQVEEVGSAEWVERTNARYRVATNAQPSNVINLDAERARRAPVAEIPYDKVIDMTDVAAIEAKIVQLFEEREAQNDSAKAA